MQATMANLRKHLDTLSEKLHKVCYHINPEAKLYIQSVKRRKCWIPARVLLETGYQQSTVDRKTTHYLLFSLQADLNFALQTNYLLHYQKQLQKLLTVNYDGRFIWKFKIKGEPFSDIQKVIFERSFSITELLYHYWALSTASANWSLFICDKLEGCHWDHEKIKFGKTPSSLLDWSMSPWKHNKEEGERCIS